MQHARRCHNIIPGPQSIAPVGCSWERPNQQQQQQQQQQQHQFSDSNARATRVAREVQREGFSFCCLFLLFAFLFFAFAFAFAFAAMPTPVPSRVRRRLPADLRRSLHGWRVPHFAAGDLPAEALVASASASACACACACARVCAIHAQSALRIHAWCVGCCFAPAALQAHLMPAYPGYFLVRLPYEVLVPAHPLDPNRAPFTGVQRVSAPAISNPAQ
jgi:hypothetical protein